MRVFASGVNCYTGACRGIVQLFQLSATASRGQGESDTEKNKVVKHFHFVANRLGLISDCWMVIDQIGKDKI